MKGEKPYYAQITVAPQVGVTRNGSFAQYGSVAFTLNATDFKLGKTETKTEPIYYTHYWKFKISGDTSYGSGFVDKTVHYGDDYVILLNKKGVEYPKYTDSQSGKKLWEPPANLVKATPPTGDYRAPFIKDYEKNFGIPKNFTWDEIHVHHMQPKAYGGSNNINNLIPVYKTGYNGGKGIISHNVLNTWWDHY